MTLLVSSGSQKIQFSFIIFRISLQASVLFFSPVQLQFIVLDEEIQAFRTSKRWKLFRHLLGNNTPPLWSCCYNCPSLPSTSPQPSFSFIILFLLSPAQHQNMLLWYKVTHESFRLTSSSVSTLDSKISLQIEISSQVGVSLACFLLNRCIIK